MVITGGEFGAGFTVIVTVSVAESPPASASVTVSVNVCVPLVKEQLHKTSADITFPPNSHT